MTLDGFLTFLALAVAIYAIAPPVLKLRARLGLPLQILLAFVALVLVLYFEFFQLFGRPCPAALGDACRWLAFPEDNSFTPSQAAFFVIFVWMGMALAIHKLSWRGAGSLSAMSHIVDLLIYEKRFSEVLELVEPHLSLIDHAAHRKLPRQRLHDRVASLKGFEKNSIMAFMATAREAEESNNSHGPILRTLQRWFGSLAVLLPAQRQAEIAAKEIARILFRSADLRRFISQMRPYFATSLLRLDFHEMYDFSNAYFGDLISDPGSVLYEELGQNLTISVREGYLFPEHNRLLHFLFSDARMGDKLKVWKPIGDHLLSMLRPNESRDYVAYLNRRPESFDEERWKDPIFTGIVFFDLMVTAAAHQGIQWHMWLYYLPIIVERLEGIYDTSDPAVDTSDEFPTRAARLIYESINAVRDWVGLLANLPEDSPHRQIKRGRDGDNGNIPVSAALALGSCMATIAMSDRIDDRFAGYMHEVVMRGISNLGRDGEEGQLRSFLIDSIVRGGQRDIDHQYGQRLATFLLMADHFLRGDVRDYEAALKAEYPGVLP